MVTFLTEFLWVILIVLPNSTWESTFPSHPTIFPTKLSSVLTVWWYPTCVLELHFWSRSLLNTWETTLSYFRSLFKDHTRPIIVYQLSSPEGYFHWMDNLTFQRTFRSFPNCFTNLSQTFQTVKFFLNFFLDLTFRVSFITYGCQIFYKCKYKYVTRQAKSRNYFKNKIF